MSELPPDDSASQSEHKRRTLRAPQKVCEEPTNNVDEVARGTVNPRADKAVKPLKNLSSGTVVWVKQISFPWYVQIQEIIDTKQTHTHTHTGTRDEISFIIG